MTREPKGRRVKCIDTGEDGNSLSAYKDPETGKYYSSEGAMNQYVRMQNYRKQCISEFYCLLGYSDWQKFPSIIFRRLKEWEKYGYDTVLEAMELANKECTRALNNKEFSSESHKAAYICKIIENNLNDALKIVVQKRKQRQQKIDEIISEKQMVEIDIDTVGNNIKGKDITNLVGEI